MGFLELLANEPRIYATAVLTVILSITLHELAHGYVAVKLGDWTPVNTGHMTWNPLVHMGPFSILACFIAGIAWGQMPIDPTRLRGKYGESYVALAGPATNLLLAILALTALGLWLRFGGPTMEGDFRTENGRMVLSVFGNVNLLLFIFNLLPVPPLDGSRVAANLNRDYAHWASNPQNQGVMILLFIAAFVVARVLIRPLTNVASAYVNLLGGGAV